MEKESVKISKKKKSFRISNTTKWEIKLWRQRLRRHIQSKAKWLSRNSHFNSHVERSSWSLTEATIDTCKKFKDTGKLGNLLGEFVRSYRRQSSIVALWILNQRCVPDLLKVATLANLQVSWLRRDILRNLAKTPITSEYIRDVLMPTGSQVFDIQFEMLGADTIGPYEAELGHGLLLQAVEYLEFTKDTTLRGHSGNIYETVNTVWKRFHKKGGHDDKADLRPFVNDILRKS